MPLVELTGFLGANRVIDPRFLPAGLGVSSVNQKPTGSGNLEPWRVPLAISGPSIVASALTLYRMGRSTPSVSQHWLSWTTRVHAIRGFDPEDTTERTYFTGTD